MMKRFAGLLLVLCLAAFLCIGTAESVPVEEAAEDPAGTEYEDEAGDESDVMLADDDEAAEADFQEDTVEARDLKPGDEGDDVTELQQKLTDLGYYNGTVSGKYGDATRAAVTSFQTDFDLEATGEADTSTQAVLFATLYRPLKYGSSGDDVKRLQTRLMELGYYKGKVSGNYLDGTRSAVESFQKQNSLDETGEADVDTQTLLYMGSAIGKNGAADPTATPTPEQGFLVDENLPEDAVATPEEYVTYSKRLARGSTGNLVKQLQTRLTELGYYTGPISGNFLGKTTTAVKTFQKQNGLDADGVVGETTWNMIFNDTTVVLPDDTARPTPSPTPVPYYIVVDVNNQVTTVYGRDENGDYTVVVREMICSTGTKAYPSDVGDWVTNGRRAKWCYFPKWGGYARYWTRINSNIAFHSVCYNAVDTMAMSTSSYKALGSRASHGCVRLLVADAKWVYDNVGEGVTVHITEDLPDDPELVASVKKPDLDKSIMQPKTTPEPTATPVYSSTGTPPLPLETINKGDTSEAVYWLQCKLKDLGYYNGKCSGTYLGGTADAVKAYQKDHKLHLSSNSVSVEMLEMLYADVLATATPEPSDSPTPESIPEPTGAN